MKKKVLCLYGDGTDIPAMLAGMLQKELGDEYLVESAGVQQGCAGLHINPLAFNCLFERGIGAGSYQVRCALGNETLEEADCVVYVGLETENEIIRFFAGDRLTQLVFVDRCTNGIWIPKDASIEEYRACARNIERCIPEVAEEIRSSR